jgi:hypothetical protein
MVDDRPETSEPAPEPGRAKRAPPTIDLEASEVTGETHNAGAQAQVQDQPERPPQASAAVPISAWVIAAVSGAVAAALVIAVGWMLGWPAIQPATPGAPQINAAVIDDLAARIAGVESKAGKFSATTPDPAAAQRLDALEKSLASLRGELERSRAQSEKLAADLSEVKAAPRETAPLPDIAAVDERLGQLERATKVESAEIAQQTASTAEVKAADDLPLRRVVTAALLDISVRHGDPYVAALAAAKSLNPDPDALKSLDGFAASGVPTPDALCRELLTLVPKLEPPAPDNAVTGDGVVDRLEAGAAKLVRIERTDRSGSGRDAIVGRITAAALRNDFALARRELNTLAPADRAAAQSWIDQADARDAALSASRQFADQAMADLAKPRQ